jgi:hypothetical protein
MTQAFNLSQLANNVNTSGQINAATGLYNSIPVANGGTGLATVTAGRLLLGAGTSNMTELAGASAGQVVTWSGTAWGAAAASGGSIPVLIAATTPGTWPKPALVKGIKVTVVGGGGSTPGVVGPTVQRVSGGGGGGAATLIYPAPSLPGPQPYTVGTAGNTSSFGVAPITIISATGGGGGGGGRGGAGGIGSNGTMNMGGSAGGTVTSVGAGGVGGGSIFGGGGSAGEINDAPGQNGRNYGGGAGGGVSSGLGPATAATGATGVVIIEEFY